ncbi:immunoglobulin lambda-1 light chain [Pleuronectes platessa]|uniref:immunoglobulin lambda-1 light chain n=1 Tax=Pleuronectes platessa TaxID=8262 RepID=UPI00232A1605|nr:immunoglobulin lambda-1 light chain [Pleuronectes platessa]
MLLLPAAALCCLCSALVATAAELTQDQLSLTATIGGEASFSCGGTDQHNYIWWFQKKDTGTFRQILHISRDGSINKGYNHPQKDDFTAKRQQNRCELKIKKVKPSHAATYYCAGWGAGAHISFTVWLIFGSGTKLFVTDRPVVTPVVSVYPAASIAALDGKSSLLCVASNMVPPLVQFSWTRQREGGPLETLSSAHGEQLELRGAGRTAAIMVVDRHVSYTYNYSCHVRHEGGAVEAPAEQVVSAAQPPTTPAPTTPAQTTPAPTTPAPTPPAQTPPAAWARSQRQVKLLCLLYTLLMVKSLVYCGGLALIHILRNRERPAAAHQTTEFPAAASTSH